MALVNAVCCLLWQGVQCYLKKKKKKHSIWYKAEICPERNVFAISFCIFLLSYEKT